MSASSVISVAIVGAGRMGRHHATNLAAIPGAKILGVADVSQSAAQELAESAGATAFVDYREMLDQLKPDAVYLCTPASDHLEQLTFAAERGINVFVEKPLAGTMAEATAAADVVERHGIICSAGYQWRYSPVADAARDALGGNPVTLLAGWWYWTIPLVPWIKDKRWGGGQVFDQATHLIDLMRYLAGDVESTYAAYASNAVPQEELPNWDANTLSIRFRDGAVGSIHCSYALFPGIPESNGLDVVARDVLARVNLGGTTVFRPNADPVATNPPPDWTIDQPFIAALQRNAPEDVRASAREAAKSVAVSLAANYSAVTGKVVDLAAFMADPPTDAEIMPIGPPEIA